MGQPRIALAGTSSFVGAALCEALDPRLGIRILTRSMARRAPHPGIEVRPCDHFSRGELEAALQGIEVAVYLVHNRDPSARLDQAQSRDMDLLVADNFAWAAARNGVRQILCRAPLVRNPRRTTARNALELEEVLASRGVPLTVLRTGLVLGPGGELPKLLARMVLRLPSIPLPPLAEQELRPLTLASMLAAFQHCMGDPATYGRSFDLFGPEPTTLRAMLLEVATQLERRPGLPVLPDMPEALLADRMKEVFPGIHPEFLAYLMDQFSAGTAGAANPVQEAATRGQAPLREVLEACLGSDRLPPARSQRKLDDDALRQSRRVRSIQRLRLPRGRNAEWVAERYFPWLGELMRPFLGTERDQAGSWTVRLRPGGLVLLRLAFRPTHSTPDRRMYFITGGALARAVGGRTARLEFRDLLDGRFTLVAIHDFDPALPWHFYRFTQAAFHGLVMKAFQGYMEQRTEGGTMR